MSLDPAYVSKLAQSYLPQVQAISNPLGQTAVSGLRERAAQAGLENSPFAVTSEAGLRGQIANQATIDAFNNAMQTATTRASIISGSPIPQYNSPLAAAANAYLGAYAYGGKNAISFNFNNRTPYYTGTGQSFASQYPPGNTFFPYQPTTGVPRNFNDYALGGSR